MSPYTVPKSAHGAYSVPDGDISQCLLCVFFASLDPGDFGANPWLGVSLTGRRLYARQNCLEEVVGRGEIISCSGGYCMIMQQKNSSNFTNEKTGFIRIPCTRKWVTAACTK